jgi:23S rRNA pseudouridine2605 synthase
MTDKKMRKKSPRKSHLPGHVPLERALSKLGIASRTQAREMISSGRVRINGILRKNPLFQVTPEKMALEIDGQRIGRQQWRTLLFHKPRSVVTTRSDEKGRATVFTTLGEAGKNLHSVGRLDFATTGLLLLTNDTKLSSWLTDPANKIPRLYIVTIRGEFTDETRVRAEKGLMDEGEFLQAARVKILKNSGRESHLSVELCEGKNREIRRLFSPSDMR